jgi:hypothetical protein
VNVQATLDWRDYMVSDYSDAGQERLLADRGIALIRCIGRLAGPGVVEVDRLGPSSSRWGPPMLPGAVASLRDAEGISSVNTAIKWTGGIG